MPTWWSRFIGVTAALVTLTGIWLVNRYLFAVPNPGAIYFIAVVYATYIGGFRAGLVSSACTIAFSFLYFSAPGHLFQLRPEDWQRIAIVSFGSVAISLLVGLLKARTIEAMERERRARIAVEAANRRLVVLQAALDEASPGVVLLDHELRAQFVNRAFRKLWNLPDEVADRQPPFVALVYHGRNTNAYAVPEERLDEYVAERVRRVRAGDLDPLDIKMSNGDTVRLECTVLPAGGRMLTYTPVTDLVKRASIDSLSGLFNRRHFMELAEGEWSRFDRYERPLSLMMLDIDLFKTINDRYGHQVGDHAIAHIAALCRDGKRTSDVVARIGGEEFALLLPETSLESGRQVAERLRRAVADTPLMIAGAPIPITVSIGVAEANTEMVDVAALMRAADQALYGAKHAGRNRVVAADDASAPVALAS